MNILFTRFPLESAQGGAEVQTVSLMKGLREKGHRVAFLGSCPVLTDWAVREGALAVRALDIGPPPVTKWSAIRFFWSRVWMRHALTRAFDAGGPDGKPWDAVCMLSMTEKLLLTEHALAAGARVLWIEHDHIGRWFTHNPWMPRLARLSKRVHTITVSDASRYHYLHAGWPRERVIAIPNGIDADRIGPPKLNAQQCHPEYMHIGCVARLTKDKGVHILIEAMSALPDMRLSIVGSGRDSKMIKAAIQRSSARANIRILPMMDSIGDFYRSIDALVLPSIGHDPFGMVAAEAMFVGVPVIVTDACGIAGYLRSGTDAIVIHPNNAESLAEALQMLRSAHLRETIAAAARQTAHERFSADAMIRRYEEMLLVGGNASTS